MNSLVDWLLEQDTVESSILSSCHHQGEVAKTDVGEIVKLVIMGDVEFIMNRIESYKPYDFLPQESMAAFQELNTNIDEEVEDINEEIVVATMGSAK